VSDPATLSAVCILASLVLYALFGGADFGGGVWDLLARGPRASERRRLVARAIGPVWETNHIWIIVAIVVLFTAFPGAFAVVCTALFVPLTIVLAGIVLRGAAFAFHAYRLHEERGTGRWGVVFASASLVTPVFLGIVFGAIRVQELTHTTNACGGLLEFLQLPRELIERRLQHDHVVEEQIDRPHCDRV